MDKATPTPSPASVDSFMSLLRNHENRISETYGVLQDRRIPSEEVRAAIDASSEARNALIAEVERLAAQAAPTDEEALRQLMGMNEAAIDAELLAAGISPDDAVKRADRAIKGALATIRAERRAIEYGDIVHKQVVAMRAAVVAAKLESPEVGIQWIANTLFGPGHYPDIEAARELGGAQALFDKEMAEHEAFRAAHPAPVADQPSQAPVVQAMKATSEPLQRYTLRRPKDAADYMAKDSDGQWVKYDDLKADRASSGATPAGARMLTTEEIADCCNGLMRDNSAIETWIRRAVKKAFAVNAGKRIPADGVIGGV